MIELGDKVKDTISGLVGIAVHRKEYLNGCVQYGVEAKIKPGATEIPLWNIDEEQLIIVSKKNKPKAKKKPVGGPMTKEKL